MFIKSERKKKNTAASASRSKVVADGTFNKLCSKVVSEYTNSILPTQKLQEAEAAAQAAQASYMASAMKAMKEKSFVALQTGKDFSLELKTKCAFTAVSWDILIHLVHALAKIYVMHALR